MRDQDDIQDSSSTPSPINGAEPVTLDTPAPARSGDNKPFRPSHISDTPATLGIYQDVLSACMEAFAFSDWHGWSQGTRPLHDDLVEKIYLQLRRLKRATANSDSPVYMRLKDILGEFLDAGMEYNRKEFLELCEVQKLVPLLRHRGDQIEQIQKIVNLALEVKVIAEVTRRTKRTQEQLRDLTDKVEQALHKNMDLTQLEVAEMFGFSRGCFRNACLRQVWDVHEARKRDLKAARRESGVTRTTKRRNKRSMTDG